MNNCCFNGDMEDMNKSSCDFRKLRMNSGRESSYKSQMGRFGAEQVIMFDNQPKKFKGIITVRNLRYVNGKGKDRNPQEVTGMEYGFYAEVFR